MGTAQGIGNQMGGGGMPPYGIYVTQQPVQTLPMHQVSIFFSFFYFVRFLSKPLVLDLDLLTHSVNTVVVVVFFIICVIFLALTFNLFFPYIFPHRILSHTSTNTGPFCFLQSQESGNVSRQGSGQPKGGNKQYNSNPYWAN